MDRALDPRYCILPVPVEFACLSVITDCLELSNCLKKYGKIDSERLRFGAPTKARRPNKRQRKLIRKMKKLFDGICKTEQHVFALLQHPTHRKLGLNSVKDLTKDTFPEWFELLGRSEPDYFRNPIDQANKIESVVFELPYLRLSGYPVGDWLCRPFRGQRHETEAGPLWDYNLNLMTKLAKCILLLLLCFAFILPLSILSYRLASREVGIALVFVFYVLFLLLITWLDVKWEHMIVVVLAYGAMAGGNLLGVS
ncbi:hypothetical protein GQ53DRAFT_811837 [Thozetella sp. PMI_491]|nr:hypothetical protein GQ53DRAFT_811837 [Thozetella sp. PMI_491]